MSVSITDSNGDRWLCPDRLAGRISGFTQRPDRMAQLGCSREGVSMVRKVSRPTPAQAVSGRFRARMAKGAKRVGSVPQFNMLVGGGGFPGSGPGFGFPPPGGGPVGRLDVGDVLKGIGKEILKRGASQECREGCYKVPFLDECVCPGDVFPGGEPATQDPGGVAVQGSFDLPAIRPTVERRVHRTCPAGMVLGRDDLCYPKQVLSRRNRFRKWRQPPRPKISAADWKAIRKAERLKERLKDLTKAHPGLNTAKNK